MDKANNSTRLIIDFSKLEENQVLKRIEAVQCYRRGIWVYVSSRIFPGLKNDLLGVIEFSELEASSGGESCNLYSVIIVNENCIPEFVIRWIDKDYLTAIHDSAFTEERGHLVVDYANILLFNITVGHSVMKRTELTILRPDPR